MYVKISDFLGKLEWKMVHWMRPGWKGAHSCKGRNLTHELNSSQLTDSPEIICAMCKVVWLLQCAQSSLLHACPRLGSLVVNARFSSIYFLFVLCGGVHFSHVTTINLLNWFHWLAISRTFTHSSLLAWKTMTLWLIYASLTFAWFSRPRDGTKALGAYFDWNFHHGSILTIDTMMVVCL